MNRQEIFLETVSRPGEPEGDLTVVESRSRWNFTVQKADLSVSPVTALHTRLLSGSC
jgi:hypothetical protein